MFRMLVLAALIGIPTLAAAQEAPVPVQRVRSVTLVGDQKCPEAKGEEIVVCSTIDPDEQYRVPKQFRDAPKVDAASQSWVNRAAAIDEAGRVAGGLPNTCSAVGTGGQTGCTQKMLRDYAAERAEKKRLERSIP